MYHYEYVSKRLAEPLVQALIQIIHNVQDELREYFTFQFRFVGSYKRNMITADSRTNQGFDVDTNLSVNDDEYYTPAEIRTMLFNAIKRNGQSFGFNACEQSTTVITLKRVNYFYSEIEYGCDFAIVYEKGKCPQYIRYRKKQSDFIRANKKISNFELEKRADYLKENGKWEQVRSLYLKKKNENTNPDKHSFSLYSEAINESFLRFKPH